MHVPFVQVMALRNMYACYSQHQMWHPMGQLMSTSGIQQGDGDPLGPLLFALLVLHCTHSKKISIGQPPVQRNA